MPLNSPELMLLKICSTKQFLRGCCEACEDLPESCCLPTWFARPAVAMVRYIGTIFDVDALRQNVRHANIKTPCEQN
jgi:hypothetical protein